MGDKSAEKTAKAFSAISPLLGLGATVAGAIPGMKKAKQSKVRVSGIPIAQAALGAAAQGHGVGRGGNFLQGLRHSGRAGQMVAQQSLSAQTANERTNIATEQARRQRIGEFSKDAAAGVSLLGTGLVESANARKAERLAEKDATVAGMLGADGQGQISGIDPNTGLQIGDNPYARTIEGAQAHLNDFSERRKAAGIPDAEEGGTNLMDEPPSLEELQKNPELTQGQLLEAYQAEWAELENTQMRNRTEALAQSRAINGMGNLEGLYSIAPDLEYNNKVSNFGMDEINRRGLSMPNALGPFLRIAGLDINQILNPPTQPFFEDGDEENG